MRLKIIFSNPGPHTIIGQVPSCGDFVDSESLLLWLYFEPRPKLIWCPLHGLKWPQIQKKTLCLYAVWNTVNDHGLTPEYSCKTFGMLAEST